MTDGFDHKANDDFDHALQQRYQRLALLTLDLAEEAGQAAVNFSFVERQNKAGPFERRIAAMTRAIWAHRVVEKLRLSHKQNLTGNNVVTDNVRIEQAATTPSVSDTAAKPPRIFTNGFAPAFSDMSHAGFDEINALRDDAAIFSEALFAAPPLSENDQPLVPLDEGVKNLKPETPCNRAQQMQMLPSPIPFSNGQLSFGDQDIAGITSPSPSPMIYPNAHAPLFTGEGGQDRLPCNAGSKSCGTMAPCMRAPPALSL